MAKVTRQKRVVSWLLAIVLGMLAGGAVLVAGYLALLLVAPAAVWASHERARPLGWGGLTIGLGAGISGLLALANGRCAAFNVSGPNYFRECVAPDLTPYLVASGALVGVGVIVSLVGVARSSAQTT